MRFVLNWIQRRKLGFKEKNVRRILLGMKANGDFEELNREELKAEVPGIAMSVALVLQSENSQAFCDADAKGIDWDEFFEMLSKLIEMLMPFILK